MESNDDENGRMAVEEPHASGVTTGVSSAPGGITDRSREGWRGVLTTVALVAACLVILNTGIQILPDDPISGSVPLLSVLTLQRVLILVGIACLLIASPRRETFATPVDIPVVLLVLLAAGSVYRAGFSLISGDDGSPLRRFVTAVAVLYLVVGVLRRHRDATPVLLVTVLAAAFAAASTGLAQYSQSVNTGFCRAGLVNTETCEPGAIIRSIGTFTNPNLLSGYLIMALPLTVGLLRGASSRRFRVAWWLLVGIGVLGLLVTFSRAATAALVAVVVVGLLVAALRGRRWQAVGLPLAVIVAGVTLAILLVALVTGTFARLTGRQELWDAALAAARRGGIDGVGYGRAGDVMSALSGGDYSHAHNLWLNWLIDVGPLGPVVITALLVVAGVAGARRAAAGSLLAAGAVGSLAAVSMASLTDHPTTLARNAVLLFVAVACAVAGPDPVPPRGGGHVADALLPATRRPREAASGHSPSPLPLQVPLQVPLQDHAHGGPVPAPAAFGGVGGIGAAADRGFEEPLAPAGWDPSGVERPWVEPDEVRRADADGAGRGVVADDRDRAGHVPHRAAVASDDLLPSDTALRERTEPDEARSEDRPVEATAQPTEDPEGAARGGGRGRLGRRLGRRQAEPSPLVPPFGVGQSAPRPGDVPTWPPPAGDRAALDDTGFGGVPIVPFGPPQDAEAVTAAIPLVGGYAFSGYAPESDVRPAAGYEADSYPPVGYSGNGYPGDPYESNGHGANGYAPNGYGVNGYGVNGFDVNGYDANGYDANGYDANGYAPNGYGANGYAPNGYAPNGYADARDSSGADMWGGDARAPGADPYAPSAQPHDAGRRGRRRGRRDPRGR